LEDILARSLLHILSLVSEADIAKLFLGALMGFLVTLLVTEPLKARSAKARAESDAVSALRFALARLLAEIYTYGYYRRMVADQSDRTKMDAGIRTRLVWLSNSLIDPSLKEVSKYPLRASEPVVARRIVELIAPLKSSADGDLIVLADALRGIHLQFETQFEARTLDRNQMSKLVVPLMEKDDSQFLLNSVVELRALAGRPVTVLPESNE
jgi:hypothetical protein